jgi:hypothetical protein
MAIKSSSKSPELKDLLINFQATRLCLSANSMVLHAPAIIKSLSCAIGKVQVATSSYLLFQVGLR